MTVAGTGHRPDKLGGYSKEAGDALFTVASDYLQKTQPSLVISGGALGWDTELALAAISLGIPLSVYIPFLGQDSVWPIESQTVYRHILNKARSVVCICDGGYAAFKMQVRNEAMVDSCDLVVAMFNGTKGGTLNCLKYAEKKGRPIVNLYEQWKNK